MVLLGAPSSIGLRPDHNTGRPQHVDAAPAALRSLGVADRLGAEDLGDVLPPPYEDFVRPPRRARNEAGVASYSRSLAGRVATGLDRGRFELVVGGDCSVVLGCLLGARAGGHEVGLAYVDAHADFATPDESQTGSVASMALALAVGRGDTPLARLTGPTPLVRPEHVALVCRRDEGQSYGHEALGASAILDLTYAAVKSRMSAETTAAVFEHVAGANVARFWVLVDVDVLDPSVMPATGSPEPNGPYVDELATLVAPLVGHPKACGLALTLYDPSLDADRTSGERLITLLEKVLAGGSHVAPA
ncbi:MAG: arginase family protein [Candidatus Limnocylindria bacterium]